MDAWMKAFAWMAGIAALFSALPASAAPQAVPPGLTSGGVAAGVDQQRGWEPKKDDVEVVADMQLPEMQGSDVRIGVKALHFTGLEDSMAESELQAFIAPFLQDEMTVNELWKIATMVTNYLHKEGFMSAIAVLPEQEIVDGHVTMQVLLGHYDRAAFENTSPLVTSRAVSFLPAARSGKTILRGPLDRELLILNDLPGIKAHAYLSPGRTTGTADILFRLETTEREGGAVYVDNYGSRYTGRYRFGGYYYRNNIAHIGDKLAIGALRSHTDDIRSYDVSYELPVGNGGTFVGIEGYKTDYVLGKQYRKFEMDGMSQGWRLYTRTPMKRTLNHNTWFRLEYGETNYSDRIHIIGYDAEKKNRALRVGFEGLWRSSTQAATATLTHTVGGMTMENAIARWQYADTAGSYQKTELDAYDFWQIGHSVTLTTQLSAQVAWDNLDSGEKLYIGGHNAVRAFPQSEAGGDHGILGSLELGIQIPRTRLQIIPFYDIGWVQYRKDYSGPDDQRTLAGAGIGLAFSNPGHSYARLDWAYPLTDKYSESAGHDMHGMWWFQFVQSF